MELDKLGIADYHLRFDNIRGEISYCRRNKSKAKRYFQKLLDVYGYEDVDFDSVYGHIFRQSQVIFAPTYQVAVATLAICYAFIRTESLNVHNRKFKKAASSVDHNNENEAAMIDYLVNYPKYTKKSWIFEPFHTDWLPQSTSRLPTNKAQLLVSDADLEQLRILEKYHDLK